jgi:hypothetical protein
MELDGDSAKEMYRNSPVVHEKETKKTLLNLIAEEGVRGDGIQKELKIDDKGSKRRRDPLYM